VDLEDQLNLVDPADLLILECLVIQLHLEDLEDQLNLVDPADQ
jgi:hypothetical protein